MPASIQTKIIETSDGRFFNVVEINDPALSHLYYGVAVKNVCGKWAPTAAALRRDRPELVRKAATRVIAAA